VRAAGPLGEQTLRDLSISVRKRMS